MHGAPTTEDTISKIAETAAAAAATTTAAVVIEKPPDFYCSGAGAV